MSKYYTPMSQRDSRWGGTWMNNDRTTPTSLFGCLNTCLGMLADVTPDSVNYYQMAIKNYTPGTSKLARWDLSWTCGKVKYRGQSGSYPSTAFPDADVIKLTEWLKNNPAILEVDFYPFDSTDPDIPPQRGEQQHFVLAIEAVGDVANPAIRIIDPWDGKDKLLCPRFGKTNRSALIRTIYFEA